MKRPALFLLLLLALAAGLAFRWVEQRVATPMLPGATIEIELAVPKGSPARALGPLLQNQGLIADARLWRYYLWRRGGLSAKAGRHLVSPGWNLPRLADALEASPLPDDVPFGLIEGWRLRDTDAALAAQGLISPGAYAGAAGASTGYTALFPLPAASLEGYLYPETYRVVPEGFDVRDLVQRQLDTFAERFYVPYQAEIAASGRTLHQLVILASLLEREEPIPGQRPLVAGILWKRIDAGTPLGVNATSRYLLPQWNDRLAFLQRLRDPKDPWNTRLHAGLPPGPIGAPTLDSLLAALRPVNSPYWYYLHDSARQLHPSRNAEEHEALRRKYNVY